MFTYDLLVAEYLDAHLKKTYRVGMDVRNLEQARLLLTQSAFRQN